MAKQVSWNRLGVRAEKADGERLRRRVLRASRYPVWSAWAIGVVAAIDIAVTAVLVFILGHRSFLAEAELTAGIIAITLFLFLTYGLYRGIRVRKEAVTLPSGGDFPLSDAADAVLNVGWVDPTALGFDIDSGCLGVVVGVLVAILVMVLLVVLGWLLLPVVWGVLAVLILAVFWVFNRALRQVFARSRRCRGDRAASLGYAFLYTVLYTGWLFIVAWGVHRITLQ